MAAPTINTLRVTIKDMDALSQEGFGQIRAIAGLALRSLETPEGSRDMESIAHAFWAIAGRAEDVGDCINSLAEGAGCAWVNVDEQRRREASRAAEVAHA